MQILAGARDFVFPKQSRPAVWPTQPSLQQIRGVKQPGGEINFSHPPSAKVKNEWNCTSAHPICLCSVKRDNFSFLPLHFFFSSYVT